MKCKECGQMNCMEHGMKRYADGSGPPPPPSSEHRYLLFQNGKWSWFTKADLKPGEVYFIGKPDGSYNPVPVEFGTPEFDSEDTAAGGTSTTGGAASLPPPATGAAGTTAGGSNTQNQSLPPPAPPPPAVPRNPHVPGTNYVPAGRTPTGVQTYRDPNTGSRYQDQSRNNVSSGAYADPNTPPPSGYNPWLWDRRNDIQTPAFEAGPNGGIQSGVGTFTLPGGGTIAPQTALLGSIAQDVVDPNRPMEFRSNIADEARAGYRAQGNSDQSIDDNIIRAQAPQGVDPNQFLYDVRQRQVQQHQAQAQGTLATQQELGGMSAAERAWLDSNYVGGGGAGGLQNIDAETRNWWLAEARAKSMGDGSGTPPPPPAAPMRGDQPKDMYEGPDYRREAMFAGGTDMGNPYIPRYAAGMKSRGEILAETGINTGVNKRYMPEEGISQPQNPWTYDPATGGASHGGGGGSNNGGGFPRDLNSGVGRLPGGGMPNGGWDPTRPLGPNQPNGGRTPEQIAKIRAEMARRRGQMPAGQGQMPPRIPNPYVPQRPPDEMAIGTPGTSAYPYQRQPGFRRG